MYIGHFTDRRVDIYGTGGVVLATLPLPLLRPLQAESRPSPPAPRHPGMWSIMRKIARPAGIRTEQHGVS